MDGWVWRDIKAAVVAYFVVFYQHCPGQTAEDLDMASVFGMWQWYDMQPICTELASMHVYKKCKCK